MRTATHRGLGVYASSDDGKGRFDWTVDDRGDYVETRGAVPPCSTYGIPDDEWGMAGDKTWINGEFQARDLDAREGKWVPGLVRVTWPTSETTSVTLESTTLSREKLLAVAEGK